MSKLNDDLKLLFCVAQKISDNLKMHSDYAEFVGSTNDADDLRNLIKYIRLNYSDFVQAAER
jgi:hypothetical protein